MNRCLMVVLCIAFFSMGCGKPGEKKDEGASPKVTSEVAAQEKSSGNILRIGPDTIRELRITTAVVKTEPGGEA
jgi:hypothetical protein